MDDIANAIIWRPTLTRVGAFIGEFLTQIAYFKMDNINEGTVLNKIWSPGKKMLENLADAFGKFIQKIK